MYGHTSYFQIFFGVLLAFSWIISLVGAQAQTSSPSLSPSLQSSSPNPDYPDYSAEKYNYATTFRQNVCELQKSIDNNTIKLEDALSGVALRTVALKGKYFLFDDATGTRNETYGGIIVEIMDELAKRAKFTWRDSYTVINDEVGENKTFTDLLKWSTSTYDMSLDWWTFDVNRISLGITFPEGWYDSTIIMVGKETPESESNSVKLWAWAQPFSLGVWLLIIATVIVSGFVYWFLELIDKHSDTQGLEQSLAHNIFLSGVNFTTHFFFQPRTDGARLFTLSLSFWAMVVGATYTANLASFLVVKSNTSAFQLTTLDDAIISRQRLCVYKGTAAEEAIYRNFGPNNNELNNIIIGFETVEGQFQGLNSDECDLVVSTLSSWRTWEHENSVNGACDLERIGQPYKAFPAGFATISDSGTKCTSLITDVINYWMWNLKEEGFIDTAWQHHLERLGDKSCPEEESTDSSQSIAQLDMKSMGGIFAFHGILSVLAIIISYVYKCAGWDKKPRFSKTGPGNRQSVRQMMEERQKSGAVLNKRELRLLSASREKSVSELFQEVSTLFSFASPNAVGSASSLPQTDDVLELSQRNSLSTGSAASADEEYDTVPDIHGEDDLYQFLEPRRSTIMAQRRITDSSSNVAGQIARISARTDEQMDSMKIMREEMKIMMAIMKEKLP